MTNAFTSEGFDLDAIPSNDKQGGETVYEIGGGATTSVTTPPPRDEEKDQKKEEDDDNDEPDPLSQSEENKARGNEMFKKGDYSSALEFYSNAISSCPGMTGEEILTLRDEFEERQREVSYQRHLKESDRRRRPKDKEEPKEEEEEEENDDDDDDDDKKEEENNAPFRIPPHPHASPLSIYHANRAACYLRLDDNESALSDCDVAILLNPSYVKAILRRMSVHEAMEDVDKALGDARLARELSPRDRTIGRHVDRLQKLSDEKMEKLKEETLGKLKDLGNSILGNFGLSMDNFKAEKDPNTGSYSISFNQNK